jgi:dTDP-glucose 4,6-dehydratase
MREFSTILVTGGAGFIGSHFISLLARNGDFTGRIVVLDLLTYAGSTANLDAARQSIAPGRLVFQQGDVCDRELTADLFRRYEIDAVTHFAAETHVDNAITDPSVFVRSNVQGTFSLLEAARTFWGSRTDVLFHQISTDEVFGALGGSGSFNEQSPYNPLNPYAATKAAADHLARSYAHTYGIPLTISFSSNNYGPRQYREKLIPLMISRMLSGETLPLYGDGLQVREWLYAEDHADAVWRIMRSGRVGESYAVGSGMELRNVDLLQMLCSRVADRAGISRKKLLSQVRFVKDRKGHDRRYALDSGKIRKDLGWIPATSFEEGLRETVDWYCSASGAEG